MSDYIVTLEALISTHTPLARRDQLIRHRHLLWCISTHTPHAGRDVIVFSMFLCFGYFYSHAPCGARPESSVAKAYEKLTISTHTPRAGCDQDCEQNQEDECISTHTPHAGRD